jgi:hypothetical protein
LPGSMKACAFRRGGLGLPYLRFGFDGFDLAIRLVRCVLELGQRPQGFFGRIR